MQPEFICIGFQKCGTTTLYDLLRQHKDVVLTADVKEPMVYRNDFFYRHLGGKEWYERRFFGNVSENDPRLRGEVNAGLGMNGCAGKIGRDYPHSTRLIFMMRSPADRAYSAYKYFLALGFLPLHAMEYDKLNGHPEGFDRYVRYVLGNRTRRDKIMKHRQRYLVFSQGNYGTLIGEYLQYFPKKNMHFILFEDFVKDEKAACLELYDFLDITDDPSVQYGLKSNEGNFRARGNAWAKTGICDMGLYYFLYEFEDCSRRFPRFYEQYRTKMHEKIQGRCVMPETDFGKMLPQTRSVLERYYRSEVESIEKLLDRSLKGIWY